LKTAACLALLCLGASLQPSAAPSPLQNPEGRETTSLDGDWAFLVDPYENGYYDYRHQVNKNNYGKDAKAKNKQELIEYDFDRCEKLKVPGDWNSQREDLKYYEGTLWYRRLFNAQPKEGQRQFLRFDAANYQAVVWLNGEMLGGHEGGFTPFEFEVTGRLKGVGNSLVVKVDNKRAAEYVPTLQTDWWNYGGLTRHVSLIETPDTFVRDYELSLSPDGQGLDGWAEFDGAQAGGAVLKVEIAELGAKTDAKADGQGLARFHIDGQVQLWSPKKPKLYDVTLSSGASVIRDSLGFRSLAVRGQDILLNQHPIFLKGICLHEEAFGPKGGRATSAQEDRALLQTAKDLGCNFVRLAHYPHNEAMLREADRLGLLVWAEVPVYWVIAWENPATYANAEAQLSSMIHRDHNRASVAIWSVGNETPPGAARLKFMKSLALKAKALDPSRLLSAALEQHGDTTRQVDDPLGAYLDVLGLNEYIGWYDGAPDKCRLMTYRCAYDKPLIVSEFGGDAKAGLHGPKEERWNEEYQAWIYREQLDMLLKIPNLRGLSPWILKDFRSPRRWLPGVQDGWNRKGLVDETGKKKLAFKVLQDFYESSGTRP
jgi:beta-glucuronidase